MNLTLEGINPVRQANFSLAHIENVSFKAAVLRGALFTMSTIRNTSFEGADLINAAFNQTIISDTSFSGANLNLARFDGAQLASVDFSEADVSEASFRNVSYTALPNFGKTAWWLAIGWKRDEIANDMAVQVQRNKRPRVNTRSSTSRSTSFKKNRMMEIFLPSIVR
jgi:uncharacterized protein YjbI with pentapeptide repeats